MKRKFSLQFLISILMISIVACHSKKDKPETHNTPVPEQKIDIPEFSADSAYQYVARQVSFGPRVPGSEAQIACSDWLIHKLELYFKASNTIRQKAQVKLFNGDIVPAINVIGIYNPEARKRILLCAHWDSRMVADHDTENRDQPIDGANDGGSGVAVLIEIARLLKIKPLQNLGVDIVLFDVEDQGKPDNMGYKSERNDYLTWCLGSQYWASHRHRPEFHYQYGILLDMVGADKATFYKEGGSMDYAPRVVNLVWKEAHASGYANYFPASIGQRVTDDHVFVNQILDIPIIDIIHLNKETRTFAPTWHTHADKLDAISKATLKAVGQTLINVLYKENAGLIVM